MLSQQGAGPENMSIMLPQPARSEAVPIGRERGLTDQPGAGLC